VIDKDIDGTKLVSDRLEACFDCVYITQICLDSEPLTRFWEVISEFLDVVFTASEEGDITPVLSEGSCD